MSGFGRLRLIRFGLPLGLYLLAAIFEAVGGALATRRMVIPNQATPDGEGSALAPLVAHGTLAVWSLSGNVPVQGWL